LRSGDYFFLYLYFSEMGFLDFLKDVGKGIVSGIQKAANVVTKLAPAVSSVASMIPSPKAQGIAQAANLAGAIGSGLNSTGSNNLIDMIGGAATTVLPIAAQQYGSQLSPLLGGLPLGTSTAPAHAAPVM
jgi:hypothetical protein